MRVGLLIISVLIVVSKLHAQHFCAAAKINANSNSRSSVVSPYYDALQAKYDVKFYFLDVNVTNRSNAISGSVYSKAVVVAPAVDTFLAELYSGMTVDSVFVQNQRVNFTRNGDAMVVALPTAVLQGALLETKVFYHGNPPMSGSFFDGFSNGFSGRWGNQATWSLSQPNNAYLWWPSKQSLKDKIDSSWVFITTDDTLMAGSNGLLTKVTTMPNNQKRYEWKSTNPIDYYLISVAVANYVEYSNFASIPGHPPVLVQNFIYNNPQTLPTFKPQLDTIPMLITYFSELFGAYPFANEKYGHCMAPFSGGMEHQTMTTQGFFEFTINAHELGHQWFGDNVTCATWNDIFVNEGFASYLEYLALSKFKSYTAAQSQMATVHRDVMSSSGGSVYNPDSTDDIRIFDSRLSYNKGAAVIHTMRYLVDNDSLFFDGLKKYQTQFGSGTATIADLKQTMMTATGKNLASFFDQWVYGQGYPTYSMQYNQFIGYTKIVLSHQTSSVTPLFTNDISINFKRNGLPDTIIRVSVATNSDTFLFPLSGLISSAQIDPENWIVNAIGTIVANPNLAIEITTVDEQNPIEWKIFPNPVNDKLSIQGDNVNGMEYKIYDVLGKTIAEGKLMNNSIDCSSLNSGWYFLAFTKNSATLKQSFYKK